MENKHKRRLDLLSSIDDKILDRQTAQRIRLLAGFKKRRFTQRLWISVGSAAAALLLVLSSLLVIVPLLSKQVPIYTGMTVSGENTAHTLATAIHTVHYADPGNTNNNGNHYGWYDGARVLARFCSTSTRPSASSARRRTTKRSFPT